MNYYNTIIDIAESEYSLQQNPNEYRNFCEFYKELNCENILEIGCADGGNFYVMCKLSHPKGMKICIDDPNTSIYGIDHQEKIYEYMKNFSTGVHIIKKDSHSEECLYDFKNILIDNHLDFIFIDADHTYEGVKKDFEMYSPFVKKGGHIAFHDILDTPLHRSMNHGVSKFWKELVGNKKEFNSNAECMGIGIIEV